MDIGPGRTILMGRENSREGERAVPLIEAVAVHQVILGIHGKPDGLASQFGDFAELEATGNIHPLACLPNISELAVAHAERPAMGKPILNKG